jgi:prephenate dehydrogenase
VTVPADDPNPDRLERLLRLVTGPLGGTATVLTDDVHDEAAALVSHVPHVLATQLLNAVGGAPVRDVALGLAAGSFRDGTRVALTDPARTEAMVTENAAWVAPALRKAVRDLEALVAALETNAPVHEFFHAADDVRAERAEGTVRAPQPPVPLRAGWPAEVLARCTAGAVVVALTETEVRLER